MELSQEGLLFKKMKKNIGFLIKLNNDYDHYRNDLDSGYEIHHIIPLESGGSNHYSNLVWMPKVVHRSFLKLEEDYPTREAVLELCATFSNEPQLTKEEFKEMLINKKKQSILNYRLNVNKSFKERTNNGREI